MAFDITNYVKRAGQLEFEDLDYSAFSEQPLTPDVLRCLRYMHDIENHTVCYLRDLLVTRAHRDPEITTFLTFWNFEEYWHGEAIGKVLAAHGEPSGSQRVNLVRQSLGWRDRVAPLSSWLASSLVKDFVAVHMTWGAVNELSTLQGYHRLIARTEHPVLVDLLDRIIKDERRHFAFYRAQARLRLARSAQARTITRWALDHLWAPVGTGVRPQHETDFAVVAVFGDQAGMALAREMDETIGELPGLGGVSVYATALREAMARMGRRGAPAERERLATPFAALR